jgi:hypothetical protein
VTKVFARLLTVAVKVIVLPSRTWLAPVIVTDGCGCVEEFKLPEPQPAIESVAKSAVKIEGLSAGARTRQRLRKRMFRGDLLTAGRPIPRAGAELEHPDTNRVSTD